MEEETNIDEEDDYTDTTTEDNSEEYNEDEEPQDYQAERQREREGKITLIKKQPSCPHCNNNKFWKNQHGTKCTRCGYRLVKA